ncbi:ATP-dependent Clp protease proteolytic subunit-related protein 4, chloroplastic [Gossypium hirsutum]|uniref:ATP-dependent Clp protease proteolytic subunit-related protein 4, chloroplastic n=1 Tax=Gossypium hirsutum TaxID=3635 RepID=A0A1U8NQI6_GOSHI|nr:ATP-dependent Clp protease proteolytic subunit-related protein 4, chloroplastic-like [Gossypium hirsutum]
MKFGIFCYARVLAIEVIPFSRGSVWEQPPPDLSSFLYKNQIVYLGMSLVPSVTELILAEFLYLQYEYEQKPIYLYINSTGTTKVKLYAKHMGKSTEQIEEDIRRPKYFSPSEAVEYGIIDKVLYNERSSEDSGVVSDLKKAQLI